MKQFFTAITATTSLSCLLMLPTMSQTLAESQQDFIKIVAPEKLTWTDFEAVANYASQDDQERRYHEVKWENSVLEAQQRAHNADKPIIMILFFGDHRLNC